MDNLHQIHQHLLELDIMFERWIHKGKIGGNGRKNGDRWLDLAVCTISLCEDQQSCYLISLEENLVSKTLVSKGSNRALPGFFVDHVMARARNEKHSTEGESEGIIHEFWFRSTYVLWVRAQKSGEGTECDAKKRYPQFNYHMTTEKPLIMHTVKIMVEQGVSLWNCRSGYEMGLKKK